MIAPDMIIRRSQPMHELTRQGVSKGGRHGGAAVVTSLWIADQDATGGEIEVAQAEIQQLVEAHLCMS